MQGAEKKHVPEAVKLVPDRRAAHYWDAPGTTTRTFRQVLGLPEPAWDLYLVYGPEARWRGPLPPMPAHWEHQLGSRSQPRVEGLFLDPQRFAAEVEKRLGGAKGPAATR